MMKFHRSNLATAEINFEKTKKDLSEPKICFRRTPFLFRNWMRTTGMKSAENQFDIARRQVENTKIKSPIAGTVNARYVNIGTMVGAGSPVANIVDITRLKVRVNVTEQEAFQLQPGIVLKYRLMFILVKSSKVTSIISLPKRTKRTLTLWKSFCPIVKNIR